MKRRPLREWPNRIVEIPASRPDPRSADPQATQKISRADLDAALKRTKSGTRARVRSEPKLDGLAGPRDEDDSPEITIVRIDSVELETIDPSTLPAASVAPPSSPSAPPNRAPPSSSPPSSSPSAPAPATVRRFHVTPQLALLSGIAIAAIITLAALFGFFAGRITGR